MQMLAAACRSTLSPLPRRLFRVHASVCERNIAVQMLAAVCRCTLLLLPRTSADACCCLQVHIVPTAENLCRLRDVLDLHLPPHTHHQGSSSHTPAAVHKLQLHPDLSAPDRCYAVQSNGGYISWSCPSFLRQDVMHLAQILSFLPS